MCLPGLASLTRAKDLSKESFRLIGPSCTFSSKVILPNFFARSIRDVEPSMALVIMLSSLSLFSPSCSTASSSLLNLMIWLKFLMSCVRTSCSSCACFRLRFSFSRSSVSPQSASKTETSPAMVGLLVL